MPHIQQESILHKHKSSRYRKYLFTESIFTPNKGNHRSPYEWKIKPHLSSTLITLHGFQDISKIPIHNLSFALIPQVIHLKFIWCLVIFLEILMAFTGITFCYLYLSTESAIVYGIMLFTLTVTVFHSFQLPSISSIHVSLHTFLFLLNMHCYSPSPEDSPAYTIANILKAKTRIF